MEENVIVSNSEEVAVEQEQVQTYQPKGLAKGLNKFFKFKERGSTMKREVVAGISLVLISVCVLLMNTRIICETLGSDRAGYAGAYLAATIVSFVGTMLLGFVCNLPLVQVSSLGLSTAFISLLGAQNGLTYYNLLAVSFVGAIVYVVVMAIPASRKFVLAALPEPIRKALPVGTGLYMISYALKTCGVITVGSNGAVSVVDIEVYVKNKTTGDTLTTLTYTDFSFENKFLAYKTFYIFADTDREYTLPEGLTADDIEITAKALGNGKEITDSDVAPAYNREPFKRVIDFSGFGVPADWDAFWTATPEE